ncbi:hypothetical protein BH18ACT17_BH18ACT17_12540 [soil metagenome]
MSGSKARPDKPVVVVAGAGADEPQPGIEEASAVVALR